MGLFNFIYDLMLHTSLSTYLKQDIYDEYVEYILQRNDNTVKNSLELWNTIDCLEGAQYAQEL